MNREKKIEECFNDIMELKGNDEFKEMIKRLHIFLENKKTYSWTAALPNLLLMVKRGGGITTVVNAFAEYLYAAKAIEFSGKVKFIEFKLDYVSPESFFSELTRLNNVILDFAGHNLFYKGVVCINIDEWLQHINDAHFMKFLNYIASNNDKLLVILYIHSDAKNIIDNIEAVISSQIRLETLKLRFPDVNELIELVESWHKLDNGFTLTKDAKILLTETIKEISTGEHFYGFKSIVQLYNDISYNILTSDLNGKKIISADMLSCFGKDSKYVKRAKVRICTIGFAGRDL